MNKISNFVTKNIAKIIVLLSATIFLEFMEKFPYMNILLSFPYRWNSFLLISLLAILLFKLNERHTFKVALFLLGISVVLSVFGKETVAQSVGKIVYYLLWFGSIQMIIAFVRLKKPS